MIVAHGDIDEGIGYKVFNDGKVIEKKFIDIEKLAEELIETGKWNESDEIVLLACNAGTNTITSPTQELADQLQFLVWAPLGMVYFLENGKFVVSKNNDGKITKEKLTYENQRKLWKDFLPITY